MGDTTHLKNSTKDKVAFTKAIDRKFEVLKNEHKKRHLTFHVPAEIHEAIRVLRPMHARYVRGDFRHSDSEVAAEQSIARWIVDSIHALKGTAPPATSWNNLALFSKK